MNSWQANKLGLINFWYYDIEEFELDDGKLLLRGSNGSGKSVTMQSFVPLLLDGNKAPERLDPFGTRSRKLENYLLDETTDEKTAYLYMEFKRKETDNYMTIGMGMKAIKNKPLQSWYFAITDNRRIGKDIWLYREGEGRIPLTKKQLENTLGAGGFYTESQKVYMAKVNELLFGFETVDQYEELLNLLINLRSPKLSKDFKPTEIYKILTESLKVLTEDDLRPMSEAMENMDGLTGRLEEYKQAQEACKFIAYHYNQYNKYNLVSKGKTVVEVYEKLQKVGERLSRLEEDKVKNTTSLEKTLTALEDNQNSLQQVEKKYIELSSGEVFKLEKELQEIQEQLKEGDLQVKQKDKQLEDKKDKEREQRQSLKVYEVSYERTLEEVKEQLETLSELSQNLCFDEAHYIEEQLKAELEVCDFKATYVSLDRYKEKLKVAHKQMEIYEHIKQEEIKQLEEKDRLTQEKEKLEKELEKIEELLIDEKENYKVAINTWQEENLFLKVKDSLKLFSLVEQVKEVTDIYKVEDILKENLGQQEALFKESLYTKEQDKKVLQEQISALEKEISDLKVTKEVEPERTEAILKNRQRLEQANIPYVPLYKAVDFKEEVDEATKQAIEGALNEMGILDALIVDKKYEKQCLAFEGGEQDKYIFPKSNIMKHNLSLYLKVDKSELSHVKYQAVDEVLTGIFLNEDESIYIDEKGYYGIGPLKSKSVENYQLRYIGSSARKLHRQMVIAKKEEEKALLKEKEKQVLEQIEQLKEEEKQLKEEYKKRPTVDHILEGIKLSEKHSQRLEVLEERLILVQESYFQITQKLQEQKGKVFSSFEGLTIPHTLSLVGEILETLAEYRQQISQIEQNKERLLKDKDLMGYMNEAIENILQDIDDLYYEINQIKQRQMRWTSQKIALEQTLRAMNIDEVRIQIIKCLELKQTLPSHITQLATDKGNLEMQATHFIEELKLEREKKSQINQHYEEVKGIFEEEQSLNYIEVLQEKSALEQCKAVLLEYEDILKKSKDEYTTALMTSMHNYSAPLREFRIQTITLFEGADKSRIDLIAKVDGKQLGFKTLIDYIQKRMEEMRLLISDEERRVFEEVLINTISTKITSKIYLSKQWVNKINTHMENMDTSSSLRLSLKWVPKKADAEEQLDIVKLLELLERGDRCTEGDLKKIARHFNDKVKETLRMYEGTGENRNYHSIIKEVLDYRNWYEFKLFYMKENEKRKELTNNAFFQFSGGEKAMSMYVPLFSAVYARYDSCKLECPRLIAMDEAFAGVDENNIRDMFKILKELNLDYILNSQILWGDYDTVKHLAICEIIRDPSDDTVIVMRYKWDGKERTLIG